MRDHRFRGIRGDGAAGDVVEGDIEGGQRVQTSPVVMAAKQQLRRPVSGRGWEQGLCERRPGTATRSTDPIEGNQRRWRPPVRLGTIWTVIHHLFAAVMASPVQHGSTRLHRALSLAERSTVDEQGRRTARCRLCPQHDSGRPRRRRNRSGQLDAPLHARGWRASTVICPPSNRGEPLVSVIFMASCLRWPSWNGCCST